MKVLNELADLADQVNQVLCDMPDKIDEIQRRTLHKCKDSIAKAVELLEQIAYGNDPKPNEKETRDDE